MTISTPEPTRVLNVLTNIEDGGMETLVSSIYEGLGANDRRRFFIASLRGVRPTLVVTRFQTLGCTPVSFAANNLSASPRNLLALLRTTIALARFIASNRIDVVHSHDFFSATLTRISVLISATIFRHAPQRSYVTLHNMLFWLSPMCHLVNRLLSPLTTKIICVSESVRRQSITTDRIAPAKYLVIYNAVNESAFVPDPAAGRSYRRHFGFDEDDVLLGNVATFLIRKGQRYLIEAFSSLSEEFPTLKLAIFGGTRAHEESTKRELQRMIDERGLARRVRLFDATPEIRSIYNMFDVYVMPSVCEGFSLAAMEAMLMERVCVFSDINSFRELVREGENGFLFRSQDSGSLGGTLRGVIERLSDLGDVRMKARKSVLERFGYSRMIEAYAALYETCGSCTDSVGGGGSEWRRRVRSGVSGLRRCFLSPCPCEAASWGETS